MITTGYTEKCCNTFYPNASRKAMKTRSQRQPDNLSRNWRVMLRTLAVVLGLLLCFTVAVAAPVILKSDEFDRWFRALPPYAHWGLLVAVLALIARWVIRSRREARP